jgi:aminoglycoside phosphotransferase (APT) family kinase protein
VTAFNPNDHQAQCEQVLSRFLGGQVRLIRAEPLTKSTREAPWRLDVEVDGAPRAYVLRLDPREGAHEYEALQAMESVPIPTPRAYGWDPEGKALGVPCYFEDFVAGESLLPPLLAGEPWAETLFVDTVCALQSVTRAQVAAAHCFGPGETAAHSLEQAHQVLASEPKPLAEAAYAKLKGTMPPLPEVRFSNGDLYPDNMIVRERRLAGVIDWEFSGFSDPIYEVLLPFFVHPELRGRGIEERYCQRMGFDAGWLPWYRALECFTTWHWVRKTGQPFEQHTADSLSEALTRWLEEG